MNTDFAQVEADDEQINLTRFSLFFPEKRLFFQERASVFDFNFGNESSLVTANIRIRYNPREGSDLYFVYNDGLNTDRLSEIPELPRSMGRTLLVKYTYAFNF